MQLHNDDTNSFQNRRALSHAKKNSAFDISNSGSSIDIPEEISNIECILSRDTYSIRLVNSPTRRSAASALIQRMYSWRGYDTTNAEVFAHSNSWMTFEVFSQQQLFGTLTLGIDGEGGLLADALHEDELNSFRSKKRKVCELSKFAIDSQSGSKEVLASLFHLTYIYARSIHNADDAIIEVNPRHTSFYRRMLGFRTVGDVRTCSRVNAPATLMHLELDYMDAQILSWAGARKYSDKSLYPYFFSREEEEILVKKLRIAH